MLNDYSNQIDSDHKLSSAAHHLDSQWQGHLNVDLPMSSCIAKLVPDALVDNNNTKKIIDEGAIVVIIIITQ